VLTIDQINAFHLDGYLKLDGIAPLSDVIRVRNALDGLFARFPHVRGAVEHVDPASFHSRPTQEINSVTRLLPGLGRSLIYRNCRTIAEELFARPVDYVFDHALYKPPLSRNETPWHQDQAYTGVSAPLDSVHFWVALQDVASDGGCMKFIPGSHRLGLASHRPRGEGAARRTLIAEGVDGSSAVHCPVAAGGGTVHAPLTMHGADGNNSPDIRRAWILHFGPHGRWQKWRPSQLAARLTLLVRGAW